MNIIIRWIINALIVLVAAYIVPGIYVSSFWIALVVALVLAIINVTLKPIFIILTLPINILTLGLFTLVINALLLAFAASVVPGFSISGFWAAFLGALVISILHYIVNRAERKPRLV